MTPGAAGAPSPRARAEEGLRERGRAPEGAAFAPGRLNLIGEHVDHQGGLVLPVALARGVAVAWAPRADARVRLRAVDEDGDDAFDLDRAPPRGARWADLARGMAQALRERGRLGRGADLAAAGDLPPRRGLASSAAYAVAIGKALLAANGAPEPGPAEFAAIGQEVEARWAGVRCGAMDLYVAALARPGAPVLLDCRDGAHEGLPWPAGVEATWEDTGIARELPDTPYNARRAELEQGLAQVRALLPGVATLRDLDPGAWRAIEPRVSEPARRRVRHVVTEIDRVRRAADALRRGDAGALAAILDEGHESLARDFEASRPDIERLRADLRARPGVLAVRLQGAGWGGCFAVLRRGRPPA